MFTVGTVVHILPEDSTTYAGTYMVVKVNPTTYVLQREGVARKLRASHDMVHEGPLPTGAASVTTVEIPVAHALGTIVRPKTNRIRGASPADLLVVIGHTAKGHRLAVLGGATNGRYWTSVPANLLEVVPLGSVTIHEVA